MNGESQKSGWNIGIGIGLSALIGVLISALIGMLRISTKPESGSGKCPQPDGAASALPAQGTPPPEEKSRPSKKPPAGADQNVAITRPEKDTIWKTGTKYFVSAVLVLAIIWLLYISSRALSTIIFAILLTFVVHPFVRFLQRKLKMRYGTATAVTYLLVLLLIILIPFLVIPSLIEAFGFIAHIDFTEALTNISNWLMQQAAALESLPVIGASLSQSLKELADILSGTSTTAIESVVSIDYSQVGGRIAQTVEFLVKIFGPIISLATSAVFAILISLHINLSVDRINSGVRNLIPETYEDEIMDLIHRLINIWRSFLRGQLALMIAVGIMVWIGNAILGTPQALFLGFLAGLLEVIPNLGPILATIPAIILALLFGSQTSFLGLDQLNPWVFALIVVAFYILIQVAENQILVPYILGDAVDLPPMVVLSGVLIGGSAFGILGVFLATPMISSGWEIFSYLYDKILEVPPEPPPEKKPSLMDTIRGYIKQIRIPRPLRDRKHTGKAKDNGAESGESHPASHAAPSLAQGE